MTAPRRPVDDRFLLAGSTLDGRVDIDAPVAQGGFGVVYRGRHRGLDVPVAVKVLRVPEQYAGAVRAEFHHRFTQEARIVYQLAHPAIVRLLDHGVSRMPTGEQAPWMVLEWLDGVTLGAAWRAKEAPWTIGEALALLRPVIEALAVAHAAGVCHRDVTPGNIFLCDTPAGTSARLIDFGIARVMEPDEDAPSGQTQTRSTITAFSRRYGAPEQFGHTRTGPWTDVHALALIVTEMVAGCDAYQGRDGAELLASAMSPARPTPAQKGVDVGPYEPVLAKALALRPGDRYADAGEFLRALDAAALALPVVASPRRARVALGLAAVAVVGLAGLALHSARRLPQPVTASTPAPRPVPPSVPAAPVVERAPVVEPAPAAPAPAAPTPRAVPRTRPARPRTAAPPSAFDQPPNPFAR